MAKLVKSIWSRRVIIYIILVIVACPLLMVFGAFTPENLGFLEPVLCPPGMRLAQERETRIGDEGDQAPFFTYSCTDGEHQVELVEE